MNGHGGDDGVVMDEHGGEEQVATEERGGEEQAMDEQKEEEQEESKLRIMAKSVDSLPGKDELKYNKLVARKTDVLSVSRHPKQQLLSFSLSNL